MWQKALAAEAVLAGIGKDKIRAYVADGKGSYTLSPPFEGLSDGEFAELRSDLQGWATAVRWGGDGVGGTTIRGHGATFGGAIQLLSELQTDQYAAGQGKAWPAKTKFFLGSAPAVVAEAGARVRQHRGTFDSAPGEGDADAGDKAYVALDFLLNGTAFGAMSGTAQWKGGGAGDDATNKTRDLAVLHRMAAFAGVPTDTPPTGGLKGAQRVAIVTALWGMQRGSGGGPHAESAPARKRPRIEGSWSSTGHPAIGMFPAPDESDEGED